jgi:hypothetical protein
MNLIPAKRRTSKIAITGFSLLLTATVSARAAEFDVFTGLGTLGGTTSNPNGTVTYQLRVGFSQRL